MSLRSNNQGEDLNLAQLFRIDLPAACKRYRDYSLHLKQLFKKTKARSSQYHTERCARHPVCEGEHGRQAADLESESCCLAYGDAFSGDYKERMGPIELSEALDPYLEHITALEAADRQMVSIIDDIWFKHTDILRSHGKKQELVQFRNKFRHEVDTLDSLVGRRGFYFNSEKFLEAKWRAL